MTYAEALDIIRDGLRANGRSEYGVAVDLENVLKAVFAGPLTEDAYDVSAPAAWLSPPITSQTEILATRDNRREKPKISKKSEKYWKAMIISQSGMICHLCGRYCILKEHYRAEDDSRLDYNKIMQVVVLPDDFSPPHKALASCTSCSSRFHSARGRGHDIRDMFGRSFLGRIPQTNTLVRQLPPHSPAKLFDAVNDFVEKAPRFSFLFWFEKDKKEFAAAICDEVEYPIVIDKHGDPIHPRIK